VTGRFGHGGANYYDQLGNGANIDSNVPVQVLGLNETWSIIVMANFEPIHKNNSEGHNMRVQDIYAIPPDSDGWRLLPNGNKVMLGDSVKLGYDVQFGQYVSVGSGTRIGSFVWTGNLVAFGSNVEVGNKVMIGHAVTIGDNVKLGNGVILGNNVVLCDDVRLGDNVVLGDHAFLNSGTTSDTLYKDFISALPEVFEAWKWVTAERKSPFSDVVRDYPDGAIVEEPAAIHDNQETGVGLYVVRPGYRPEYLGLALPKSTLICLRVEVRREDVCFGGLPTRDAILRVKRLRVLNQIG
jgi:acetyltransferase-like isoleucine patch superfamily enzyme